MSDGDFTVIGPECFSTPAEDVISWKGVNYYKACDEPVVVGPDGSGTHCVKREGHPGDIHEDYDGARKTDVKNRYVIAVSVPFDPTHEGYAEVHEVMQNLRTQLGDKEGRLIYNAIRETADQLIMILEGDG